MAEDRKATLSQDRARMIEKVLFAANYLSEDEKIDREKIPVLAASLLTDLLHLAAKNKITFRDPDPNQWASAACKYFRAEGGDLPNGPAPST